MGKDYIMNDISKKILMFGFGDFAGNIIAANLRGRMEESGIYTCKIDKKEYLTPLGLHASAAGTGKSAREAAGRIPGFGTLGEYDGDELPVRILLFVGFGSDELDEALAVCRECGIGREDLKAVLTPNNAFWNVLMLSRELSEEHRLMNP